MDARNRINEQIFFLQQEIAAAQQAIANLIESINIIRGCGINSDSAVKNLEKAIACSQNIITVNTEAIRVLKEDSER